MLRQCKTHRCDCYRLYLQSVLLLLHALQLSSLLRLQLLNFTLQTTEQQTQRIKSEFKTHVSQTGPLKMLFSSVFLVPACRILLCHHHRIPPGMCHINIRLFNMRAVCLSEGGHESKLFVQQICL